MKENCIKNSDHILKVYFQMVSSREILRGNIDWREFPENTFTRLCRIEIPYLSDTEIAAIYNRKKHNMRDDSETESELNVFRLLKRVADHLLTIRNDKPVCRYQSMLRWRMLVQTLGEDLPICAYLAGRTEMLTGFWDDFEWDTVISHDNQQLSRILEKGCADNHFHLFGSAPSFHLTWLKLMNHPAAQRCREAVKELEKNKRTYDVHYVNEDRDDSMETLLYKAALIRYTLVWILYCASSGNSKELERLDDIILETDFRLNQPESLNLAYESLQGKINALRLGASLQSRQNEVDYALIGSKSQSINHDFEGERRFLYQMLLGYAGSFELTPDMMRWFYAYLVIKGRFYREFIQVNETVGFANFSIYNSRKNKFLYSEEDREQMIRHAVVQPFKNRVVSYLEMRISPKKSVPGYRETILAYDNYISDRGRRPDFLEKCCYVVHFPKQQDKVPHLEDYRAFDMLSLCRHQKYREKISSQAAALCKFRMQAQKQASWVYGIDACAMEIGCRPEVFGPIFRMLSEHIVPERNMYQVPQLKITYHVGEDFLDLTDGLRAIDEAILFLNMKRGDRLGHATALGIDVRNWYRIKQQVVNIEKQDYLDNVVWLYHKLIEFDVRGCENLKEYLMMEYHTVFEQIYAESMDEEFVNDIIHDIRLEKTGEEISAERKNREFYSFDIDTYYEAWKLRGDDPTCYRESRYVCTMTKRLQYKERINWTIQGGYGIRNNAKAVALYLMYHYSAGVRKKGSQIFRKEIPLMYIEGVEQVQKKMQWLVASKGIGIETNPSSNLQISTIESYQEHPISRLYNMGLTTDPQELRSCPQMNVSINTDDQGVFHTSLGNEFALMGSAMEHIEQEDGSYKYQGQMVYEWLDRIREMGMEQRFMG